MWTYRDVRADTLGDLRADHGHLRADVDADERRVKKTAREEDHQGSHHMVPTGTFPSPFDAG